MPKCGYRRVHMQPWTWSQTRSDASSRRNSGALHPDSLFTALQPSRRLKASGGFVPYESSPIWLVKNSTVPVPGDCGPGPFSCEAFGMKLRVLLEALDALYIARQALLSMARPLRETDAVVFLTGHSETVRQTHPCVRRKTVEPRCSAPGTATLGAAAQHHSDWPLAERPPPNRLSWAPSKQGAPNRQSIHTRIRNLPDHL